MIRNTTCEIIRNYVPLVNEELCLQALANQIFGLSTVNKFKNKY